ncbi:mitochondrial fission ELM1 family protein [Hyphobacterium sp.]|uniref:mitochondrial fission ELM1 family protein n=1 Tax=Hyphobacterium sp. TaxID=2004662 RepID=UPI003747847C
MSAEPEIWAVADGRRGVENQAIGLAEALARETGGQMHRALIRDDGYVTLPDAENPAIWIGCGRPAIDVAKKHRKNYPKARFIYVQDPRGHYQLFDTIVAPAHDQLVRKNALAMIGSPNRLTMERLTREREKFADRLAPLPAPRAALLIGGPNKRLTMTADVQASLLDRARWLMDNGYNLMITTSRRTPASLVRALSALATDDRCWVFSGEGENPFFAFLAAADLIFATEDSTNMLTEAAFTGTPVYSLPLEGNPGKFRLLHAALEARNALRPCLGRMDRWTYEPLDETRRIAKLLAHSFDRGDKR